MCLCGYNHAEISGMRSVLLLCFSVQSIIRNLFALFYSYKFCMYPQNLNLYKNELIANLERAATNVKQGSRAAPNRRPTPTTARSDPGGPNWQTDIQSRSRQQGSIRAAPIGRQLSEPHHDFLESRGHSMWRVNVLGSFPNDWPASIIPAPNGWGNV